MNKLLEQLKRNLESAEASMRNNTGSPNVYWIREQLTLIRCIEEAGTISGEWDGLFVGRLDSLLKQKQHVEYHYEIMHETAAANTEVDPEKFRAIVRTTLDITRKHQEDCAAFIALFGDRLALNGESQ